MTNPPRPPDGSHGPHAFVDDLGRPRLDEGDLHHLQRVVRLRPGDPMTIGDGRGSWRRCRFGQEPDPVDEIVYVPRPEPPLGVGFALIKGGRPELVVQKLTELGIDRILLFAAARSVVRWDPDKTARNIERLGRVVREAAMQCRRAWLPEVAFTSLAEVLAEPGTVMADATGGDSLDGARLVVVGPEGGWTDEERDAAPATVRLARHVLRAETAAIAAGVLLGQRRVA